MNGEAFLLAVFGSFVFFRVASFELHFLREEIQSKLRDLRELRVVRRQTSFERHGVQQYCSTGDENFESHKLWATYM